MPTRPAETVSPEPTDDSAIGERTLPGDNATRGEGGYRAARMKSQRQNAKQEQSTCRGLGNQANVVQSRLVDSRTPRSVAEMFNRDP